MTDSTENVQIAQEILTEMSLKERTAFANLNESDIPYLQHAFDACVRSQPGTDDEIGRDIMQRIWAILQETHRVRCVK
jgi:hypothetical protein